MRSESRSFLTGVVFIIEWFPPYDVANVKERTPIIRELDAPTPPLTILFLPHKIAFMMAPCYAHPSTRVENLISHLLRSDVNGAISMKVAP